MRQFITKFKGLPIDNHSYKLAELLINNLNTDPELLKMTPRDSISPNASILSELVEEVKDLDQFFTSGQWFTEANTLTNTSTTTLAINSQFNTSFGSVDRSVLLEALDLNILIH